jgi:phosphate transport system substrate-binding protein
MKRMRASIAATLSLIFFSFLPVAYPAESITIKGSDTMVNLGQAWAETFMEDHPETLIAVTGGGSGTGIAALLSRTCDVAQSSRHMSPKEYEMAKQKNISVKEIETAVDAIVFAVHPDNPIQQLTIEQLSNIFTEKITNWRELGGTDEPILVLSRERNSGTHVHVLEEVVRKGKKDGREEFAPSVVMMPSSQAIVQEIATNHTAIGYFGLGYLSSRVKALSVFQEKTGEYVTPNLEHAMDKTYPISRPLLFYLPGEPEGVVKEFVDFVLSEKGQTVVREMDFVPLTVE